MSQDFLPYGRQSIDQQDIEAVLEVLKSSHLTQGPGVARFEQKLQSVLEAEHVSACSNGTAALHLAYAAPGLWPGDELITSHITFLATTHAARMLGVHMQDASDEEKPDWNVLGAPPPDRPGVHLWLVMSPGRKVMDLDKETRERLKALGYLGN